MLVNGTWSKDWDPVQKSDEKGRFVRQTSSFRSWITPDGSAGPTGDAGFKAEPGRYRLYVAFICPWASRTLMARALKGLEDLIPVTVVNPALTDQGWTFVFMGANQDSYSTGGGLGFADGSVQDFAATPDSVRDSFAEFSRGTSSYRAKPRLRRQMENQVFFEGRKLAEEALLDQEADRD